MTTNSSDCNVLWKEVGTCPPKQQIKTMASNQLTNNSAFNNLVLNLFALELTLSSVQWHIVLDNRA